MEDKTVSRLGAPIRISLIVATIGRVDEVLLLLRSLASQGFHDFELIMVDQNSDNRLDGLIERYSRSIRIRHLRTVSAGVCRARNLGSQHAQGDWLVFPDDDCWYPADFLQKAENLIVHQGADFYSGRAMNAAGETIMGAFPEEGAAIVRANVWTTLIEWMVVIRKSTFLDVGGFDERIGPGAGTPWGAYEIQDLLLRCLALGATGYYDPSFIGHHPDDRVDQTSPEAIAKMRRYSAGAGFVMRKHGYTYTQFLPRLMRPLVGMGIYALSGRAAMARRSSQIFMGRLSGWRMNVDGHGGDKAKQSGTTA